MPLSQPMRWVPSDTDLKHAFESDEFEVYYQPIIDLRSRHLAGAEALIRWQHPERGLLTPGSFILQAEASGFSIPLSEWTQWTACREAQAWHLAGLDLPILSINVAIAQARPGYLAPLFRSILAETRLDPMRLAIEFHEEVLPDLAIARTVLAELAPIGVALWSDDFGTGPSALPYLTHFPFTVMKIEKEFIWTMVDDPNWARLVTGLIGLAHHLDLTVIAEGVTTEAQLELLYANGCDMVQGHYFSPPVPAHVITALLQAGGEVPMNTGLID